MYVTYEAIKWLEQIKLCVHGGDEWFDGKRTEALDVAIQALKEKEIEPTKGD